MVKGQKGMNSYSKFYKKILQQLITNFTRFNPNPYFYQVSLMVELIKYDMINPLVIYMYKNTK